MKSLYSKPFLIFFRFLSLFLLVIHYLQLKQAIYNFSCYKGYKYLLDLIPAVISPCFLIMILFRPEKFVLLAISLSFCAIDNILANSNPGFPIIEIEISILLLYIRRFYNKHTKLKIATSVILALGIHCLYLFQGWNIFKVQTYNAILFLSLSAIFIVCFYEILKTKQSQNQVLNIANFPETTKRDAKWLCLVQQGVKYEAIAIDYDLNLGTVQNRLNKVYHIIETGDRIGFLSMYSNAKIIFQPSQ